VVFIVAHIHWFLGGTILRPNVPPASLDLFNVVVVCMFVVGFVVPLVAARPPAATVPRRIVAAALWLGCAVLLVRGAAGVVDEILRLTGLSTDGLTGLTREEQTGYADPPPRVLWTGWTIEAYFVLGGLLFGVAARRFGWPRPVR